MNGMSEIALDAQTFAEASPKLQKLKKASDDFEAGFVKQLVAVMNKSLHAGEKTPGMGSQTQQDMADDVFSDALSKQFHLGLSESMFDHLSKVVMDQTSRDIRTRSIKNAEEGLPAESSPATQEEAEQGLNSKKPISNDNQNLKGGPGLAFQKNQGAQ